jgi:hypothetical protein
MNRSMQPIGSSAALLWHSYLWATSCWPRAAVLAQLARASLSAIQVTVGGLHPHVLLSHYYGSSVAALQMRTSTRMADVQGARRHQALPDPEQGQGPRRDPDCHGRLSGLLSNALMSDASCDAGGVKAAAGYCSSRERDCGPQPRWHLGPKENSTCRRQGRVVTSPPNTAKENSMPRSKYFWLAGPGAQSRHTRPGRRCRPCARRRAVAHIVYAWRRSSRAAGGAMLGAGRDINCWPPLEGLASGLIAISTVPQPKLVSDLCTFCLFSLLWFACRALMRRVPWP